MVELQYCGHSFFAITHGENRILIDPIFNNTKMPYKKICSLKKINSLKKISLIFITNEMEEHFDKEAVKKIALRDNATVVASDIVLNELKLPRDLTCSIDAKKEFVLKGVKVKSKIAHYPKCFFPTSYLLEIGNKKIYHAGATKLIDDFSSIRADIALMPMNKQSMDVVDVVRAAKMMKPKKLVPMQHDSLEVFCGDAKDLKNRINESVLDTETIILKPGKKLKI
jgi:L-ascorbate metabolism protein UlaG (beta-lactamase superfamily)